MTRYTGKYIEIQHSMGAMEKTVYKAALMNRVLTLLSQLISAVNKDTLSRAALDEYTLKMTSYFEQLKTFLTSRAITQTDFGDGDGLVLKGIVLALATQVGTDYTAQFSSYFPSSSASAAAASAQEEGVCATPLYTARQSVASGYHARLLDNSIQHGHSESYLRRILADIFHLVGESLEVGRKKTLSGHYDCFNNATYIHNLAALNIIQGRLNRDMTTEDLQEMLDFSYHARALTPYSGTQGSIITTKYAALYPYLRLALIGPSNAMSFQKARTALTTKGFQTFRPHDEVVSAAFLKTILRYCIDPETLVSALTTSSIADDMGDFEARACETHTSSTSEVGSLIFYFLESPNSINILCDHILWRQKKYNALGASHLLELFTFVVNNYPTHSERPIEEVLEPAVGVVVDTLIEKGEFEETLPPDVIDIYKKLRERQYSKPAVLTIEDQPSTQEGPGFFAIPVATAATAHASETSSTPALIADKFALSEKIKQHHKTLVIGMTSLSRNETEMTVYQDKTNALVAALDYLAERTTYQEFLTILKTMPQYSQRRGFFGPSTVGRLIEEVKAFQGRLETEQSATSKKQL